MNPNQLHVLLIGIDAYDGGGSLNGCVNDIDAIQGVLLDRLSVPFDRIRRLASPRTDASYDTRIDADLPTLENIKRELDRLASEEVQTTSRVFIYYSGHGTQLKLKDQSGRRFAREAILPKDKVHGPSYRFLLDWEINEAIDKICQRCHSATVILDCCSSAGVTRDFAAPKGANRYFELPEEVEFDSFRFDNSSRGVAESLLGHANKCQVVAACQANEKAKEDTEAGVTMGHLSRSLCERLQECTDNQLADLRWGHIWQNVQARVLERNSAQRPWISEGIGRAVFGGDQTIIGDVGIGVVQQQDMYQLDIGTLGGVTVGAKIGVYGPEPIEFPPLRSEQDTNARVGELQVIEAKKASSLASAIGELTLPSTVRGRLIEPGEAEKLNVVLKPTDEEVIDALDASSFVDVVDDESDADIELVKVNGSWCLGDDIHGIEPDDPKFPFIDDRNPRQLRSVVEHYYAYSAPLRLARRCQDLPNLLKITLLDCNEIDLTPRNAQDIKLHEVSGCSKARYAVSTGDKVSIAVNNHSSHDLYVHLFNVAASGRVLKLGCAHIPYHASHRYWFNDTIGVPFPFSLPHNKPIGIDRLVAIGVTNPELTFDYLIRRERFADLVERYRPVDLGAVTRDLGDDKPDPPPVDKITSVTTVIWVTSRTPTVNKGNS